MQITFTPTVDETNRTVDIETNSIIKTTTYLPYQPEPLVETISMQSIKDNRATLAEQVTNIGDADDLLVEDWDYGIGGGLIDPS